VTERTVNVDLMRQLADQSNRHDPWPIYAQLREERVFHAEDGHHVLSRYDDVTALLHDPRISSDPRQATDPGTRSVLPTPMSIATDPPEHERLRSIATRYFGPPHSPGLVAGMEPAIRNLVRTLIDDFPDSGEVDAVDAFAYPLPVSVICGLLGVPQADEAQFSSWTAAVVAGLDAGTRRDQRNW
jgi:cytochrome P450